MSEMAMFYSAAAALAGGGGPSPPGAPQNVNATNNGTTYKIVWTDAVAQDVEVYRDGVLFDTVGPGVEEVVAGTMFGDGTRVWTLRHILPASDFSGVTTVDGIVSGGGGPSGSPSGLSVYEYAGGLKFGIQWGNGDSSAQTSLERDSSEFALTGPGTSSQDVGDKAGDGNHSWRCRHLKNGVYSSYSETISTSDGIEL